MIYMTYQNEKTTHRQNHSQRFNGLEKISFMSNDMIIDNIKDVIDSMRLIKTLTKIFNDQKNNGIQGNHQTNSGNRWQ